MSTNGRDRLKKIKIKLIKILTLMILGFIEK